MVKVFLIVSLTAALSFAKLSVSVTYNIPHQAMPKVLEGFISCQMREEMEVGCISRPFEDTNRDLVIIACGPNLPDKEGKGCKLNFWEKAEKEKAKFRMGVSKEISLNPLKTALLSIEKRLHEAKAGLQHLNFGNPFFEQSENVNYVCERKNEKVDWYCYLDVSER